MLSADLSIFEQTISKARLNSYRSYFNADLREAVGLYMRNAEVSSIGLLVAAFSGFIKTTEKFLPASFRTLRKPRKRAFADPALRHGLESMQIIVMQ